MNHVMLVRNYSNLQICKFPMRYKYGNMSLVTFARRNVCPMHYELTRNKHEIHHERH